MFELNKDIQQKSGTPLDAINAMDNLMSIYSGEGSPETPTVNQPVQEQQQPSGGNHGQQTKGQSKPKSRQITDADLELVEEIDKEEAKKDKEYRRKEVIRKIKAFYADLRWKGIVKVDDAGEVHKLDEQRYNEEIQNLEAERAEKLAKLHSTRNMGVGEASKLRKEITTLDWAIENARRLGEGAKKFTKPILHSK